MKALAIGQRQELDITARSSQEWMQQLTDEELLTLKMIRDRALQRSIPAIAPPVTQDEPSNGS